MPDSSDQPVLECSQKGQPPLFRLPNLPTSAAQRACRLAATHMSVHTTAALPPHHCTAAKRAYRQLSMLVHPDRCAHAAAEDAFAAASQAYDLLREAGEELLRAPLPPLEQETDDDEESSGGEARNGEAGRGSGSGPSQALVPHADAEDLLHQTVWNQNRLAVQAALVPPGELLRRHLLHPAYQQQFAPGSSLATEPLLFLPVADIPTLKKRRRMLTAPPQPPAEASLQIAVEPKAAAAATDLPSLLLAQLAVAEAGDGSVAVAAGVSAGTSGVSLENGSLGLLPLTQSGSDGGNGCSAMQQDALDVLVPAGSSRPDGSAGSDGSIPGAPAAAAASEEAGEEAEQLPQQPHPPQLPQLQPGEGEAQQLLAGRPQGEQEEEDIEVEEDEGDCVEGLLLVTARTALWGRFPLNGTYFQVCVGVPSVYAVCGQVWMLSGLLRCSAGFVVRAAAVGPVRCFCGCYTDASLVCRLALYCPTTAK